MDRTVPPRTGGQSSEANGRAIDNATVQAVIERSSHVLAIARRYTKSAADADDVYQRSLEILMTKAPTTNVDELVLWLGTVVRNEALRLDKRNSHFTFHSIDGMEESLPATTANPEQRVEDLADFYTGAEAVRLVGVDVARCMLLRAEGQSYGEICTGTGFTHRKVERCLADGRRRMATTSEAVEAGEICIEIEPLLHKVVDGSTDALREVRPHLRNCGYCRAVLREYYSAPKQLASAVPAGLALTGGFNALGGWVQQAVSAVQDKVGFHVLGSNQWIELGGAKQAAAVVAASAAIAGGGAVANHAVAERNEPADGAAQTSPVRGDGAPAEEPVRDDFTPRTPGPSDQEAPEETAESDPRPASGENPLAPESADAPPVAQQLPADATPPARGQSPDADAGAGDLAP